MRTTTRLLTVLAATTALVIGATPAFATTTRPVTVISANFTRAVWAYQIPLANGSKWVPVTITAASQVAAARGIINALPTTHYPTNQACPLDAVYTPALTFHSSGTSTVTVQFELGGCPDVVILYNGARQRWTLGTQQNTRAAYSAMRKVFFPHGQPLG